MTTTTHRRISIVIPCLNDAELLQHCLQSLARQTVPATEIIVVDNGSTDDSAAVAEKYGAIVVPEPRRGITWATATGFDHATGDVLVRTDADIIAPPDFVERLHRAWDAADASPGRTVVGVTGSARFMFPPHLSALGDFISRLYLGAYQRSVGSALGHFPFFGTNYSLRARWWDEVSPRIDFADTYVHEDIHLSFAVRPHETVWFQPDVSVDMDARAVKGLRQLVVRFRRGVHTMFVHFRTQPPHRRLAQRGLLGSRLGTILGRADSVKGA